jgi:hypothetical protein
MCIVRLQLKANIKEWVRLFLQQPITQTVDVGLMVLSQEQMCGSYI